jgi:hypothetical protein
MLLLKATKLFQQMYDLTKAKCCGCTKRLRPFNNVGCCNVMYCEMADAYSGEHEPVPVDERVQTDIKYLRADGCILAPHLRPICTVHNCQINSLGFVPGDPGWTKRYFKLREKIDAVIGNACAGASNPRRIEKMVDEQ